jgi:mono/diheme cytochrome c family protein
MGVRFAASLVVLALVSQACSRSSNVDESPEPEAGGPNADVTSTGQGPSAGPADAEQIALGDRIYHGKAAGGTCASCHGTKGTGSGVAPRLDDSEWLVSDGSLQSIADVITNGVPKPVKHEAAMPPKGGAQLTDEQVQAVAAYVYSLSHK